MKKINIILAGMVLFLTHLNSQTLLNADGEGETYELITSVLAPNGNPVEVPDCAHQDFGRHIDEVYDSTLKDFVFQFHIHVTPDNDRCIKFDRQRNEIKTYDKSADSLLAVEGETFEFNWKFKIDSNFQSSSSFTHLHQLKAVGGPDDGMPLITFTTRKGSPDKFELRYAAASSQSTIKKVDLDPFKGAWLQVNEVVKFGTMGSYHLEIKKIDSDEILFEYNNESIQMWKTNADFIRPKWGFYRSLNDQGNLRDEIVKFAAFSIKETPAEIIVDTIRPTVTISSNTNEPVSGIFEIAITFSEKVLNFSTNKILISNGTINNGSLETSDSIVFTASILPIATGTTTITIESGAVIDISGNTNTESNSLNILVDLPNGYHWEMNNTYSIYPNPCAGLLHIGQVYEGKNASLSMYNSSGKCLISNRIIEQSNIFDLSDFSKGVYFIQIRCEDDIFTTKILFD